MLRSLPVMEADRLVTLLTPTAGKLRATVRGARRVTSRLGGHLDLFNRVSLSLAQGRTFDVVTGAETLEAFAELKRDLHRIALALYLMELADAIVPEDAPHPNAYRLLLESLRSLNESGSNPVIPRYLELRLLEEAGYMPELRRCVACGAEVGAGRLWYGSELGGILCDACGGQQGQAFPMSVDALKALRFFAGYGFADALRLRLEPALGEELEALLAVALQHVLERGMASSGFLDHLQRLRTDDDYAASTVAQP